MPHDTKALNSTAVMTAAEKRFYDTLGHDFTTAQARQEALDINIAWKTAERYLGNFVSRYHVVQRIKNGQYQKQ